MYNQTMVMESAPGGGIKYFPTRELFQRNIQTIILTLLRITIYLSKCNLFTPKQSIAKKQQT